MELPLPSSLESFPSPTPVDEEEHVSMGNCTEEISSGSLKNKECDEGDTNEDGKDAIENCDDRVEEPKVGMEFNTVDEAYMYYARFAKEKGFAVAKKHSKKGKDGIVTQVAFQCTRGGKPRIRTSNPVRLRPQTKIGCPARLYGVLSQDGKCTLTVVVLEHNHDQSPGKSRFFKSNRIINEHVKKRIILNDKAGIHMYKTYESLQIKAGGHDKLSFTEKDCRNFLEKARRLRLGEGDAEAMHSYFMRMKADNSGFFSAYDLNEKGRLRNVFWADARSRAACKEFGDVVTFDTTYLLNKYDMPFAPFVGINHHGQSILLGCGLISHEDTESFVWLFQTWMTCMGAPPKAIITDQCTAMKNAIEIVFPNTRHRWCIWHILKKLPEKFSGCKEYDRISWRMRNAVWDSLTIEEFEVAWDSFIKNFNLQSNPWLNALYRERKRWVPTFVKDEFWAGMSSTQRSESMNAYFDGYVNSKTTLKQFVEQYENALAKKVEGEKEEDMKSWYSYIPCITEDELEKQFQSVYTQAKVREFQKEFVGKCVCALTQTIVGDVLSEYEVIENITFGEGEEKIKKRVPFTVIFNGENNEATCKCRLFECRGMLCKHQLMVFHQRGVERVPEKYVLRRWCKNVKRGHTKIRINYDNSSRTIEARRHDNVCSLYEEIADLAEDSQEKYDEVMTMGRELKRKWIEDSVVCGCNMITDTLNESCSIGDERLASKQSTSILDPEALRRKGRPPFKRKQEIVEKAVKKKRESKKKTSSKAKAKEGDEIAVGNVFGTQDNVGHTFGTQQSGVLIFGTHQSGVHSYPGYMGEQMWANIMPNYMAHGGTGFMENFPSSQSYMQSLPSSQVWTGQGQGLGGGPQNFTKMMTDSNNEEE